MKEGVFDKKQGEVMKVISGALKRDPDITWAKGTNNFIDHITNKITLKDPDAAIHENAIVTHDPPHVKNFSNYLYILHLFCTITYRKMA